MKNEKNAESYGVIPLYEKVKLEMFSLWVDSRLQFMRYRNTRKTPELRRLSTSLISLYILIKPQMMRSKKISNKKVQDLIDALEEKALKQPEKENSYFNYEESYRLLDLMTEVLEVMGVTKISYKKINPEELYKYA